MEDAVWHAWAADIAGMRDLLDEMAAAAGDHDTTASVHANWRLHARIAVVSPNVVLRSIYTSLLDLIESTPSMCSPSGSNR